MTAPDDRAAPLAARLLRRCADTVSAACGAAAAFMIVLSILITCQMIFVRSVLNESTTWQTEAVVYLMVAATLLGLPYVQLLRGHVSVDLLPMALPPGWRKALSMLTLGASLMIAGLMFVYGYEQWRTAWDRGWRSDTIWGVRLWIPYLALPVGFAGFALQLLADFYDAAAGKNVERSAEAGGPGGEAEARR